LRDEWERVTISDRPLIDPSIVLDGAEFSILLLDEEEGGGIGTFRWTNVTLLHVLLHEFFQLLLLELGEGIDLSRYGAWGVRLEFDGVVPDPWFWEALCGLLTKDFVMSLVAGRYRILGGVLSRGT
jgi:hypothetical protein